MPNIFIASTPLGKLTITQLPQYAEKLQLMDNKSSAATPQSQPQPQPQHRPQPQPQPQPPVHNQMSAVSQVCTERFNVGCLFQVLIVIVIS